jgi:CRISPR system Cascade subunit CasE
MLNPRTQIVRRDLADCQAMHRRMLSAFEEVNTSAARAELGVLYRVESDAQTGAISVLVQSSEEPEWSRLPACYLSDNEQNPPCKSISNSYATVQGGMRLRFRLRANPTRKIETKTLADGKRRNGKRVEIRDESEQAAWLERKAAQHGFRLCAVRSIDEDKRKGKRATPGDSDVQSSPPDATSARGARLTFASVLFEGELVVTDAELFHAALRRGIGTGKAYGFGLLSVASASREE